MNKKIIITLSLMGFLILIFLFIEFFGISLGSQCGYYHFAAPYREDCKCIGIKTGGCPSIAFSCDEAITSCLGIRTECYRVYHQNQTKEIISCK